MTRKEKSPYRHDGKVIPLRPAAMIEREAEQAANSPKPVKATIEYWRDVINYIKAAELELLKDRADRQAYLDRVAPLAECHAWLTLFESYWTTPEGNKQSVSAEDAETLVYNAIRIGCLIEQAKFRFLESSVVDGMEQFERGKARAADNKAKAFSITRAELLKHCRTQYRRYQCNQKELASRVSDAISGAIGAERVRQLMREHGISKADYAHAK